MGTRKGGVKMARRSGYYGFGFNPELNKNHFLVSIPDSKRADTKVCVYERFRWDADGEQKIHEEDLLKVEFERRKWSKIAETVTREFNIRLKQDRLPVGKFSSGGVPVEKRLGKELICLLWSLEGCAESCIPTALRNWLGLQPEERWWLYTMTNANTGAAGDGNRGWRVALKYIMCENPVDSRNYEQLSMGV